MDQQQGRVESYVPAATFYDGKREAAGTAFRDRFAVVDAQNAFSVLAFRGGGLQVGAPLPISRENILSLQRALAKGERVLIGTENGSALFFGDWMCEGLAPVLLLPQACADLSAAAALTFHNEIITLGTAGAPEPGRREIGELCLRFSEALAGCDRVFSVGEEPERFRNHTAHIAALAGCRADFSALSFDPFALSEVDTRRWTLLLLCLFLSLRGAGGEDPAVSLREVGRETILPGVEFSLSRDANPTTGERFAFLRHPAFRNVKLETTPEGLRLSVLLSRRARPGELCAAAPAVQFCFLLEVA